MCRTEIENLLLALDEWEAADDRANEAAVALKRPSPLRPHDFEKLRSFERTVAEKLAQVRRAVAPDFALSRF